MKINYILHNVAFEWDKQKAIANIRKHQISFELASEAFFDPFVYYFDDEIVGGELRETIIGLTKTWQLLLVVYVTRENAIRIISARSVTPVERDSYENQ